MKLVNQILSGLGTLWELSTAFLSFLLCKAVKSSMRFLVSLYFLVCKDAILKWQLVASETLSRPGALPYVMTIRPLWNPHAIMASVGPVAVKHSLSVRVASAERSARYWDIVVYTFPHYQTVANIGSLSVLPEDGYVSLDLAPGVYWIVSRYYQWTDSIELPALSIDGVKSVHAASVSRSLNDFYRDLAARGNSFYLFLHYYVFVMLKFRTWLPQSFVERELFPVSNPETQFYYGILKSGESLHVELNPSLFSAYDVYFTLYDGAIFPIRWYPITEPEHVTRKNIGKHLYLIRVHKKVPLEKPFNSDWVTITVLDQKTSEPSALAFASPG